MLCCHYQMISLIEAEVVQQLMLEGSAEEHFLLRELQSESTILAPL